MEDEDYVVLKTTTVANSLVHLPKELLRLLLDGQLGSSRLGAVSARLGSKGLAERISSEVELAAVDLLLAELGENAVAADIDSVAVARTRSLHSVVLGLPAERRESVAAGLGWVQPAEAVISAAEADRQCAWIVDELLLQAAEGLLCGLTPDSLTELYLALRGNADDSAVRGARLSKAERRQTVVLLVRSLFQLDGAPSPAKKMDPSSPSASSNRLHSYSVSPFLPRPSLAQPNHDRSSMQNEDGPDGLPGIDGPASRLWDALSDEEASKWVAPSEDPAFEAPKDELTKALELEHGSLDHASAAAQDASTSVLGRLWTSLFGGRAADVSHVKVDPEDAAAADGEVVALLDGSTLGSSVMDADAEAEAERQETVDRKEEEDDSSDLDLDAKDHEAAKRPGSRRKRRQPGDPKLRHNSISLLVQESQAREMLLGDGMLLRNNKLIKSPLRESESTSYSASDAESSEVRRSRRRNDRDDFLSLAERSLLPGPVKDAPRRSLRRSSASASSASTSEDEETAVQPLPKRRRSTRRAQ